jgi:hypothetical protein
VGKVITIEDLDDVIGDMVIDFIYYDRKQDEKIPQGAIEEAIDVDYLTIDEIVEVFRRKLVKALN